MSGSDEAVQPGAAVGDPPSPARRSVRWKKVRWGTLIAGLLKLSVPVGEIAARARLTARRVHLQTAPQALENVDSAPGNGMAAGGADPQDLAPGNGEALPPTGRGERRAKLAIGLQMAPQRLENIESAPGNGSDPDGSDRQELAPEDGEAFPPNDGSRRREGDAIGPQTAPQPIENMDSAPGSSRASDGRGAHDLLSAGGAAFHSNGDDREAEENGPQCLQLAPQGLENIDFAPGNGMAAGGADPQDLVFGRAEAARAGRQAADAAGPSAPHPLGAGASFSLDGDVTPTPSVLPGTRARASPCARRPRAA